jgi:hypothetical protein
LFKKIFKIKLIQALNISIEGDKQNKENRGEKRQFEKEINLSCSFCSKEREYICFDCDVHRELCGECNLEFHKIGDNKNHKDILKFVENKNSVKLF